MIQKCNYSTYMYTCRIHTCDIRNASDKVSLLFDKRVNQSSFLYKKLILLQSFETDSASGLNG